MDITLGPYIDSMAMGNLLSVLFLACLSFLRVLVGPMGVRGISLVYCCCNLEEMAPQLSAQNSPAWPQSPDTSGVINGLKLRVQIQKGGNDRRKVFIKSELDIMGNSRFIIVVLA